MMRTMANLPAGGALSLTLGSGVLCSWPRCLLPLAKNEKLCIISCVTATTLRLRESHLLSLPTLGLDKPRGRLALQFDDGGQRGHAGARDGAHRLLGQRQDDTAEPHPVGRP
eukprot:162666-Prymnesium_polylepis.1